MKAYPDANVYVCYLLGEAGEDDAEKFFRRSADCEFRNPTEPAPFKAGSRVPFGSSEQSDLRIYLRGSRRSPAFQRGE